MKKVVCKINPHIRETNPCCIPKLCLHYDQCYAAVGGCPLVTAVGRHSTNMAMATSTGCCATDLGMSITASFIFFALRSAQDFSNDPISSNSLKQWPLTQRVAFLLSTGIICMYAYEVMIFHIYSCFFFCCQLPRMLCCLDLFT
jgi:hypothetical protein